MSAIQCDRNMADNKRHLGNSDVLQIIDSKMLFFCGFKSKQTLQTMFQRNTAPTMTALIKTEFFSLNA